MCNRFYGRRRVSVVALAGASLLFYRAVASPQVPKELQPPAGEQLLVQVHAKGDQVYVCKEGVTEFAWNLKAPEAQLFDNDDKPFGKHFAGPSWEAKDGSRVTGKAVANAHSVKIEQESRLAQIVCTSASGGTTVAVNSSHHQSADAPGDGLRVVARSPEDGVIEALEGTAPEHFVLAVQWHPERSVNDGPEVAESAKAIFRAFIEAARMKRVELTKQLEQSLK